MRIRQNIACTMQVIGVFGVFGVVGSLELERISGIEALTYVIAFMTLCFVGIAYYNVLEKYYSRRGDKL